MLTPILLVISNIFMILAWYGHLKFESAPLWMAILGSWGLAFFEYCFQVPANRAGKGRYSVTQLKIMQECITLFVFSIIAYILFGQKLTWNNAISYALIVAAVFFSFQKEKTVPSTPASATESVGVSDEPNPQS